MVSETGSQNGRLDQVSIGSLIGERYRIDSLIDEGAMGRVFRGEHIHMKKRVAIKVLRPELTRVPEVLQRFEREALAAAHIEHQHVASARDFGKLPDGSVYLVLEYVEGITLRKELKRGRFDTARALRIGRQIALALGAAHELDIVHRDLKPENVMLLDRGGARDFVKVLDFGVAKVPIDMTQPVPTASSPRKSDDSLITKAGMVFGTPDYMAPEQALGQPVDARADLYSLGVMLFEMIAGVRPFRADHELGILGQQLSSGPPTFSQRDPELHVVPEVEKTIQALLAKETSQRPANAAAVVARLDAHLLALGEIPEPVSSMRDRLASARDSEELATLARPPGTLPDAPSHALSERVRAALPKPLQGVPSWGVALMPIALLALFAIVVSQFRSHPAEEVQGGPASEPTEASTNVASAPPTATEAAPAPTKLTDFQVEAALEAGDMAVGALLERFPEDPRSHIADARLAKKLGDPKRAVAATRRALEHDAKSRESAHLAAVLWWAVQKQDTQQAALALLEGPMKSQGADIVYDLAITDGIRPALADVARSWLRTRAFERESSKEAAAAAALLLAPTCEIRKALTKRAENVGDERSAKLLRAFSEGKGCQPGEPTPCNACLDRKAVKSALDAIAARSNTTTSRGNP